MFLLILNSCVGTTIQWHRRVMTGAAYTYFVLFKLKNFSAVGFVHEVFLKGWIRHKICSVVKLPSWRAELFPQKAVLCRLIYDLLLLQTCLELEKRAH